MEFDKVIRERKATRKFSNRPVSVEIVDKILEAGNLAPTAKNLQPLEIYVINSPEGLEFVDAASPCRYGAPCVFLVCGDKNQAFAKNEHSTYEMDATIVATHMILAATNEGLDNIWVEMFDPMVLKEKFQLGEGIEPVCLLPMGYKAEDCPESPNHLRRKDVRDYVHYV